MTARKLRVASPADRPELLSVDQAAATGDHRKLLVAMRERIATAVTDPTCPPRDLAALTRRLQDISKEIEGIDRRVEQEGRVGGDSPDEKFDSTAV